jgi:starch phosphorylase
VDERLRQIALAGRFDGDRRRAPRIPAVEFWRMRTKARKVLVDFVRQKHALELAQRGASADETRVAEHVFDPDSLTIGFARRFATYKRPNLLLHDRDRLLRILTNRQRPVQLILAGKAHPQDTAGQEMIRQWSEFITKTPARSQVVFLSDYDMRMTEHLVQGVDLWLNTPRRPWEACGTSGMKVLVNGGLNFSELDGWWAEAWAEDVGWSIGDGREHGDDPAWDAAEAQQVYSLLEDKIIQSSTIAMRPISRLRGSGKSARAWLTSRRRFLPIARCANIRKATICRQPAVFWPDRRTTHYREMLF